MLLPSGDHAACLKRPFTCVSCFTLPSALDHRKICSCPGFSSLLVQEEVKASQLPSGDHTGASLEQLVAPLGVTSFSLAGSGSAMEVRCSVEPSRPRSVQATVVPSGEMATEPGALRPTPAPRWAVRVVAAKRQRAKTASWRPKRAESGMAKAYHRLRLRKNSLGGQFEKAKATAKALNAKYAMSKRKGRKGNATAT